MSPSDAKGPAAEEKRGGAMQKGNEEVDHQAAYAAQFYAEEQAHWTASYTGEGNPPFRGGEYVGTKKVTGKPVVQKPPTKNNS
ncbi:hypothetical protein HJFPF1_04448 [Paramyrothecium foliicola]|nr:hypothetical protein HJFPF1_04448 [Paramyrothecium foliicola]